MVYRLRQTEAAAPLFQGWQETMIWSCLQDVMGSIYTDCLKRPSSAIAMLGDFCFLAGKPDRELVLYGAEQKAFLIMVPGSRGWAELIEQCHGTGAKKVIRYAFRKEPDVFDLEYLQREADRLPEGYVIQMMDEALFRRCREIDWCRDWVAQYENYSEYQKYGLGVVITRNKEPVSGASSYSGYRGGIEVEIDTREDHRKKGLAFICGAKLILECRKRGWYPGWDAQNPWSAALAEKLGYHLDYEYEAYEVTGERPLRWTYTGRNENGNIVRL